MIQDSISEVMFSLSNKKIVLKYFLYLKMVICTSYYMCYVRGVCCNNNRHAKMKIEYIK